MMLLALVVPLGVPFVDAQSNKEYSFSLAEAKGRGTFITEVEMIPSTLKWKGHTKEHTISVKDAWIEKCKDGGCYVCLHLKEGREAFFATEKAMLVLEDEDASVTMHFGRGWTQVAQHLESEDFSKARFSLIGGWKEERPKNIRFAPKKK